MKNSCLLLTTLALAAVALPAQIKKVVPSHYTNYEGNSRYAFPFAKPSAEMQILTDGTLISNGAGVISAFSFRADEPLTGYPLFSKSYQATVYPTSVTPAAMTTVPASNIGGATGTLFFNGILNVPVINPALTAPAKTFDLRVPGSLPYPFDGSKSNFLIHLKTMDTAAVPSWYPDAVSARKDKPLAEKNVVGLGCSYSPTGGGGPYSMSMSIASTAYLNGSLDVTLSRSPSTTPIGTFPFAFLGLDSTISRPGFPVDLTAVGMPSCQLFIDPVLAWRLNEDTAGNYPQLILTIPNFPGLAYVPVFLQALAAGQSGGLQGGVLTDAWQVMLVPYVPPPSIVEAIYINYGSTTPKWFGVFSNQDMYPVIEYDGVLK